MSGQRLALDGRNEHGAPQVKPLESFITIGKWVYNDTCIYCLQLDGKFVPCVSVKGEKYDYILCAAYKTKGGFTRWLNLFYPFALKEQ